MNPVQTTFPYTPKKGSFTRFVPVLFWRHTPQNMRSPHPPSSPNGLPELVPFMPLTWYVKTFGFKIYPEEPSLDAEPDFGQMRRYKYEYGFNVPTKELITELAQIIKTECGGRVLDAGSGSGFISKKLCELGVEAFAVDSVNHATKVKGRGYPIINVYQLDAVGDAVDHVKDYPAVLLSWPPFEYPFGTRILEAMAPGQWLIYAGESWGGCCADDRFFELLEDESSWQRRVDLDGRLNAPHVTMPSGNGSWRIYRKRSQSDSNK